MRHPGRPTTTHDGRGSCGPTGSELYRQRSAPAVGSGPAGTGSRPGSRGAGEQVAVPRHHQRVPGDACRRVEPGRLVRRRVLRVRHVRRTPAVPLELRPPALADGRPQHRVGERGEVRPRRRLAHSSPMKSIGVYGSVSRSAAAAAAPVRADQRGDPVAGRPVADLVVRLHGHHEPPRVGAGPVDGPPVRAAAERGPPSVVPERPLEGVGQRRSRAEVGVVALRLARGRPVQRVVDVVVPLARSGPARRRRRLRAAARSPGRCGRSPRRARAGGRARQRGRRRWRRAPRGRSARAGRAARAPRPGAARRGGSR